MTLIFQFVISFLSDGTALVLMLVPLFLFGRLVYLQWYRDVQGPRFRLTVPIRLSHEIGLLLFCVYLILLFTQTFVVNCDLNQICLIPFGTILGQISELPKDEDSFFQFMFNIVGNIGVFVPIGIFVPVLFRKQGGGTALVGFYISLVIETGQLPLDRTTDVDDLILNTAGAFLGYLCWKLIRRIVSAVSSEKTTGTQSLP